MRRTAFLAGLLFFFLPVLWAQAPTQPTAAPAQADEAVPQTPRTFPVVTPDPSTLPSRQGPTDIEILTGKADRKSRARYEGAYPYVYMNGPGWRGYGYQRGWHGGRGRDRLTFSPFLFRPFGRRGHRVFTAPRFFFPF
jgi:hypothetical protein